MIKRMCLRWLLSVFAYFAIWRLCMRGLPCACGYFGYPALVGWRVGKVGTSTGNARNEKARPGPARLVQQTRASPALAGGASANKREPHKAKGIEPEGYPPALNSLKTTL